MTARAAVIGGGLAGSEAAWQIARITGGKVAVDLFEMRPSSTTPAHKTGLLAELVCSNSLKSMSEESPSGRLKQDLAMAGSLVMQAAMAARLPAGKALAVDRDIFAGEVTRLIEDNPHINLVRKELNDIPDSYDSVIIATGPLTSPGMEKRIGELAGGENLYFYDAIAPIVEAESVASPPAFFQDRWGQPGAGDYLNLPMDKEGYYRFVDALLAGETVGFRDFEKEYYYEGCLPIEEIASRGRDSLAFGPFRPVGLEDPATGRRPFAVAQLRKEDSAGQSYNMVGFQTKLKIAGQESVFRMIPGMESARFLRHGSLHRNTYVDSPRALDGKLRFRADPGVRLAGQITGVEGYVESTALGFLAGAFTAWELTGKTYELPPRHTAFGALLGYLAKAPGQERLQPSNMNFSLLPPLANAPRGKKERRRQTLYLAREEVIKWLINHDIFIGPTVP